MPSTKKLFSSAILLFILVGLPAVSFIYLRNGANYRRSAIATMGDFGKMPDIGSLPALRGEVPEQWRGAMNVVGWLDPTKAEGTHGIRAYAR